MVQDFGTQEKDNGNFQFETVPHLSGVSGQRNMAYSGYFFFSLSLSFVCTNIYNVQGVNKPCIGCPTSTVTIGLEAIAVKESVVEFQWLYRN
jgi:hypothetical protein